MSCSPACKGQPTLLNLIYAMGIIRSPWQQVMQKKLHLAVAMGHFNGKSCHLDSAMPQVISKQHMNMLFGLDYEHFCIVYMDDL